MHYPYFRPLIALGLCLAWWQPAGAQTPNAVEQSELLKRRQELERLFHEATSQGGTAPELFLEETKDVGPQSILRIKPRRNFFEASADSQFFYTSNLLLQESGNGVKLTDTSVLVNTAQLAFIPPTVKLGDGFLASRIGYRHQWFNYGLEDGSRGLGVFDFDVSSIFADLRYRLGENWSLETGCEYLRLLNHTPAYSSYDEIYKEYTPRWGISRQFSFSESKVFTIGYRGTYHLSETPGNIPEDQNNRLDNSLMLVYTQALTPQLVVQPYYRLQHTYYDASPFGRRNDLLQSVGVSLSYFFAENFSARIFAGYDIRESDLPLVPDYRKADSGIGLNFNLRF